LEVTPDPRAAVQTVARTTPVRRSSELSAEIRERLGLVGGDYAERIIAMVTDAGIVLATSHTYVPASLDRSLNDNSWRLAALRQSDLPAEEIQNGVPTSVIRLLRPMEYIRDGGRPNGQ
jgi:hypothetical protein